MVATATKEKCTIKVHGTICHRGVGMQNQGHSVPRKFVRDRIPNQNSLPVDRFMGLSTFKREHAQGFGVCTF